jgi:drug/metabolite transporter (DMT)-like permease
VTAVLALLASLTWGVSDFVGGTLSRRLPAVAVVGLGQACSLVVLVPIVVVGTGFVAGGYLGWAVGAGVAGLTGFVALYRALAIGTMGVVSPIAATGVVVPVIGGLLIGGIPSALALAGVGVAGVGAVLAGGPELRGAGSTGNRSVLLAGVAAAGFGTAFLLLARGSATDPLSSVLVMRLTEAGLFGAAFAVLRRPVGVSGSDLVPVAGAGCLDLAATALYAVSTHGALLAVAAVLASLYPVVTVLLARRIHRETLRPVQLGGIGLALAGVALIAGGGGG